MTNFFSAFVNTTVVLVGIVVVLVVVDVVVVVLVDVVDVVELVDAVELVDVVESVDVVAGSLAVGSPDVASPKVDAPAVANGRPGSTSPVALVSMTSASDTGDTAPVVAGVNCPAVSGAADDVDAVWPGLDGTAVAAGSLRFTPGAVSLPAGTVPVRNVDTTRSTRSMRTAGVVASSTAADPSGVSTSEVTAPVGSAVPSRFGVIDSARNPTSNSPTVAVEAMSTRPVRDVGSWIGAGSSEG